MIRAGADFRTPLPSGFTPLCFAAREGRREVVQVLLKAGDPVKKDQPVLCLDAMKLENEIASPRDGTVKSVEVQPGQAVEKGQSLFTIG